MTELWEGATDEERKELMQAMVIRVELDEKEKGACDGALLPQVPSDWLGLISRMGAGRLVVVNYPPIQFPDFEVSRIPREVKKSRGSDGTQ